MRLYDRDPGKPVPKKKYKRFKPTRKQRGEIAPEEYQKVFERDGGDCVGKKLWDCECHKYAWKLECNHVLYRGQSGEGKEHNLAMLGGPSTQSGTCHYKFHTFRKYRRQLEDYMKGLYPEEWLK